ncbi:MAG: arginine--tRNA ligase [Firmicutes bacterium]|nr:arginine--tRNA ligase [Bacillota bacterium]
MTNIKQKIREQITCAVTAAIKKAGYDAVSFTVETPRERTNGDFSANAAMALAKIAKKPPFLLADELKEHISVDERYIERVEVARPGFINFYLNNEWLYEVLLLTEKLNDSYGKSNIGEGARVMVEFVSANPTGLMHMGNARGGALGDSIARILAFSGFEVTKEFYLNDSGNQIEKFALSLEARYLQLCGIDAPFDEEWYQGDDIKDRAAEFLKLHGDKYSGMPAEKRREALVKFGLEKNINIMKKTLSDYRIDYDVWFRESALYESGEVEETLKLLQEKGYAYQKEGALWFKSSDDDEKDEVLVRANGVPTYFAADIAYHRNKFENRGYDKVIDVWGADHHGHVARMKYAMEALGINPNKLEVVLMQLVRLMRGGEAARMSKRSGKAITLDVLLDEIGIDAARFFFNMRNAGSHFDFDLELAVQQSNSNPVFYVQYAHARICSIIRLLAEDEILVPPYSGIDAALLKDDAEFNLLRKISELPDEVSAAAQTLEPSRLTRYATELATEFHSFYNACRVNVESRKLCDARLKLIDATRITLANVLKLIAVDAPEKM